MPTQSTIRRLTQRIDAIVEQRSPAASLPRLVVFLGETVQEALLRHLTIRPEHRELQLQVQHWYVPRTEACELFAVHTSSEIRAALEELSAVGPARQRVRPDPHEKVAHQQRVQSRVQSIIRNANDSADGAADEA
jgi:hypothetical protein